MTTPHPQPQPSWRHPAHLCLLATLITLALPLSIVESFRPAQPPGSTSAPFPASEAFDQDLYHLVVIRRFAAQLPTPDLTDYPSATTPAYHLTQSLVFELFRGFKPPLILINLLFGLALCTIVWSSLVRWTPPWTAALLALPLVVSQYTVASSVWLTTDNAGWCLALAALGIALHTPGSGRAALQGGLAATLAVLVRQVHLWAAAPAAFTGLVGSPLRRFVPQAFRPAPEPDHLSWNHLIAGIAAFAVPCIILGVFAIAWGGLTPPHSAIEAKHGQGFAPAAPVFALAAVGVFAIPFLLAIPRTLSSAVRTPWPTLLGLTTAILACIPRTSHAPRPPLRTYGWIWKGAAELPERIIGGPVLDRSPLLIALAALGVFALTALWRTVSNERRPLASILLLSAFGFVLAQSMNSAVWQRYYEPMALFTLAVLAALALPTGATPRRKLWLVLLAAFQTLLTLALTHLPAVRFFLN